jgi:hypothetical protein
LRGRGTVGGLDTADAVTYAVISQSLLMAMSTFGNRELPGGHHPGQIASGKPD